MVLRLLIDSVHPDETRVAIVDNGRINDFDFVTSAKKQVKGNIYLAKITRVEPSLQAAFVEYGSGKQGFLPFAEIYAVCAIAWPKMVGASPTTDKTRR